MSERYIFIPNWDELQHYKDRGRPTWIKLYPRLLRNDDFVDLSATERMALIGIWMLYAESGRRLALDTTKLTRSLNQRITKRTLDRLNGAGFIEFRSRTALDEVYAREEKRREETKAWTHVWFWMRFLRDPQVMTPLPQQGINPEAMSMDSYELYEEQWTESGAPTTGAHKVLAAMGVTATPVDPYDDIPF
jgi:hypothetical protein